MNIKPYIPIGSVVFGAVMMMLSWVLQTTAVDYDAVIEKAWQSQVAEVTNDIAVMTTEQMTICEWSPWMVEVYADDSLSYWSSTDVSSQYLQIDSLYNSTGDLVLLYRFLKSSTGEYQAIDLIDAQLILAASDSIRSISTAAPLLQDLSVASIGESTSTIYLQYLALMSFIILLGGLVWIVARTLQPVISLPILVLLLFLCFWLPVELLWPDIIMSKDMMLLLRRTISLTDMVSLTIISGGLALLISSKAIKISWTRAVALAYGLVSATTLLLILRVAQGIVSHPTIQLEITQIVRFDKYSIIVLVCLATMAICHLLASIYVWYDGKYSGSKAESSHLPIVLLGVLLSGLVFYILELDIPYLVMYLYLVSYYTMIDLLIDTQRRNITWLIWWIMILSAFISVSVFYMSLIKSDDRRSQFVDSYFDSDAVLSSAEVYEIDRVITSSDFFEKLVNPPLIGQPYDKDDLTQYLRQLLSLSTLDIEVEAFDEQGVTVFSNHFGVLSDQRRLLSKSRRLTEHIYFDPLDRRYLLLYELVGDSDNGIDLYIQIEPQGSEAMSQQTDFSYAIYRQGSPIYRAVIDEVDIDLGTLYDASQSSEKVPGIAYDVATSADLAIVAYNKVAPLIKPISLFSYIFVLIGILTLLITVANSKLRLLRPPLSLKFNSRSTLRNKIQLVVILLVLFSFLVIGILTAFYFKNVIESTNRKTVKEQTSAVVNNISSLVHSIPTDVAARFVVADRIGEVRKIHDLPLALYAVDGNLIEQSSPDQLSHRIPFERYASLFGSIVSDNKVSDLMTSYVPLYHKAQEPYAILGVGHNSNIRTDQSLLDFLSTIVNVYVFLFLLGGAIAIIIANSITRPLTDLGEKLKSIKLGRRNESLEWKNNDEIGALIQDYNNLIVDLERSANIIAMTERDTAWREMAKQVAHEIKNPLTPMKLSIQYLQRAVESADDKEALINRVSDTLIEQIDNLTQIANEFSNFASMPMASNEKLLLNSIVEMIHELFRKREDMDINLVEPITDLWVYADKNHLIRVLNNILKNAIQAIPSDRRGKIEISLYKRENAAIVQVKDNGTGINDDRKDKVFTPNFTTKSSGTGLGLAISVNMMEAFNGTIYFETEEGVGTSFFVEIPLMRLDDQQDGVTRVMLD